MKQNHFVNSIDQSIQKIKKKLSSSSRHFFKSNDSEFLLENK